MSPLPKAFTLGDTSGRTIIAWPSAGEMSSSLRGASFDGNKTQGKSRQWGDRGAGAGRPVTRLLGVPREQGSRLHGREAAGPRMLARRAGAKPILAETRS